MKKIIFIVLLVGLMTPAGLKAQQLYKVGSKIILDMTEAVGMPAGSVTNVPKYTAAYMSGKTPSNTSGPMTDNAGAGTINAYVYEKLEIAPYDLNTSAQISATGPYGMTWVDAFTGCRSATYDGGGWRLPTQRELQMIFIFNIGIEDFSSVAFDSEMYWAANEEFGIYAYYVYLAVGIGTGRIVLKVNSFRTRCVREVTTP